MFKESGGSMNNKLNNLLNEFFENSKATTEEEMNEELAKFIQKYNANEFEYTNTPLDDAYELLEQAEQAKSEKQAIKLAKQAYEKCPACFDAILFQVDLEKNALKRDQLLNEGLKKEEERLKKEKYFSKDNIGHFYGIFETRPYIRGLYMKMCYLILDGKYKMAINTGKEILRLNENDNTGARYNLLALYALLEDETSLLDLYNKYEEENLEMLFPMFVFYYKQENDQKAKKYLQRIEKANPHFLKYYQGKINMDENTPPGYYSLGSESEVLMYFEIYDFLVDTMLNLDDYILANSKK